MRLALDPWLCRLLVTGLRGFQVTQVLVQGQGSSAGGRGL